MTWLLSAVKMTAIMKAYNAAGKLIGEENVIANEKPSMKINING